MTYELQLIYNVSKIFGILGFSILFHELIHILHSIYFKSYIHFDIDDQYNPTTHFRHKSPLISLYNYILAIVGGYIPIILAFRWNILKRNEFIIIIILYTIGCIHDVTEIMYL